MNKMFFIAIDARSKWMEVEVVNSGTTQATVEYLQSMIAQFGLPKVMVTDNGTCFTAVSLQNLQNVTEFVMCKLFCITHLAMAWQRDLSKP